MVDRFDRLRLDAFSCANDEHHDVRHVRAASAHRGEGLMARRIDERDLLLPQRNHPRGSVLRDASRFPSGDVCLADLVQQACLAVVDVSENRDHRRPPEHLFRIDLARFEFREELIFQRRLFLDVQLNAVFEGNRSRGIAIQRGIDGDVADPLQKEFFDDVVALDAQGGGEILDGNRLLDIDRSAALSSGLHLNVRAARAGAFNMPIERCPA